MSKLDIEEIREGAVMEATFWANPVEGSKYRFRATHLDGRRAPKVVLSDDVRIVPGMPCLVKIVAIHKPDRTDHGHLHVQVATFRSDVGYSDGRRPDSVVYSSAREDALRRDAGQVAFLAATAWALAATAIPVPAERGGPNGRPTRAELRTDEQASGRRG